MVVVVIIIIIIIIIIIPSHIQAQGSREAAMRPRRGLGAARLRLPSDAAHPSTDGASQHNA